MKFERIQPGMVLLDIHSQRMGNTKMRELCCWKVTIVSVDAVARTAMARWNGNPPRLYRERDLARLVLKPGKRYLAQQEKRAARR